MRAIPLIHSKQVELFRPSKKSHSLLFVKLTVTVKAFLIVTSSLYSLTELKKTK